MLTSSRAALRPRSGSAPAPRPRVRLVPMGTFTGAALRVERLSIGVHADELHSFESEVDHRVDGVAARATDTNHLDTRLVLLGLVGKLDRETSFSLPPGCGFAASSTRCSGACLPQVEPSSLIRLSPLVLSRCLSVCCLAKPAQNAALSQLQNPSSFAGAASLGGSLRRAPGRSRRAAGVAPRRAGCAP